MFDGEIERKVADFRELGLPEYVPREGEVHIAERMVAAVVGARRAGKSYRALQLADELTKQGTLSGIRQICHVDFDNPILAMMTPQDLGCIQSVFLKMTPECDLKTPLVFVLDEIHKIKGWEDYAIDLSSNPRWKVIVTGSSSKLLRDEIATELRGKSISSTVYPLSFREFLTFKGFSGATSSTKEKAEAMRWFDEYLKWGAYPAVARLGASLREPLLREYFDTMILRDVLQRYNVSRPRQCMHLYRYLLSNIARPHTLQSAYAYLKQSGYATSRDSVRAYIQWAEDSWLLCTVPIYSHSHKEQDRNYKKVYCIDWALAIRNSLVWDGSFSRALENVAYQHLKRSHSRVYYYLTRAKRQEVDFIALDNRGKPSVAVQVCSDLSDPATEAREVQPLQTTARYFGIKAAAIVTLNEERRIRCDGVDIEVIPAWKWLLRDLKEG